VKAVAVVLVLMLVLVLMQALVGVGVVTENGRLITQLTKKKER